MVSVHEKVEDALKDRKEATGRTWADIIQLGVEAAEKIEKRERYIDQQSNIDR